MKISFTGKTPSQVVEEFQNKLDGRKLGKMVFFELQDKNLKVTIKKLGKSFLEFTHSEKPSGMEWELSSEKIAISHKAFRNEVMDKIVKIIEQIGGKVS